MIFEVQGSILFREWGTFVDVRFIISTYIDPFQ